jgi:hypothetical protein
MKAAAEVGEKRAVRSVAGAHTPAPGVRARALALQRLAGNRATARLLARWTKHPDADKKGVMVPDVAALELERFNPPQNK